MKNQLQNVKKNKETAHTHTHTQYKTLLFGEILPKY